MTPTLPEFLTAQAEHALRYLLRETETLTPAEACADAHAAWPSQQWGIGQNGSIAGIAYHVTAWKALSLPLLTPGAQALPREALATLAPPDPMAWLAVRDWLIEIGTAWNAALNGLPASRYGEEIVWEGQRLPFWKFVAHMIAHDTQHAAQIEYLRQRRRALKTSHEGE